MLEIGNFKTIKSGNVNYNCEGSGFTKKRRQLFLLHFAGGSCFSFDFLRPHIEADIEFIPLELPGRGKRINETLLKTKESAVEDYLNQIQVLRNQEPYLIYGHSMGATISLSLTKRLEEIGDPPCHLIVSGNPGPGIQDLEKEEKGERYLMQDDDFKEELRKLGGVPEEVLENSELYRFFSPIMRADFEVLEKATPEEGFKIQVPVFAVMGSEEDNKDKIENWSRFTSKNFTSKILLGNHFFIYDHYRDLVKIMLSCYENQTNPLQKKKCSHCCQCTCLR